MGPRPGPTDSGGAWTSGDTAAWSVHRSTVALAAPDVAPRGVGIRRPLHRLTGGVERGHCRHGVVSVVDHGVGAEIGAGERDRRHLLGARGPLDPDRDRGGGGDPDEEAATLCSDRVVGSPSARSCAPPPHVRVSTGIGGQMWPPIRSIPPHLASGRDGGWAWLLALASGERGNSVERVEALRLHDVQPCVDEPGHQLRDDPGIDRSSVDRHEATAPVVGEEGLG